MGFFGKKKTEPAQDWTLSMQWSARARWISHACDFLGDPTNEWKPNPGMELPRRPEFLVLEFAPREGRPYFTYLTAGLGLVAQAPAGPMPHVELIACCEAQEPRVGQFLFMLSQDVATATAGEAAFKAYDLWGAEFFGLRDFLLVPAREDAALLDFPNLDKRKEDERWLLATTGQLTGQAKLDLLQLVPLTPEQWQRATREGSTSFLQSIDWQSQPATFGWSGMRPRA